MTPFLVRTCRAERAKLFVQERIELGPNVIFFGIGLMATSAFRLRFQFCRWSFRLVMIEIVVTPAASSRVTLRVLYGRVSAIQRPTEIAASGRFCARAIRVVARQRQLQLFEEDCSVGKDIGLLVLFV